MSEASSLDLSTVKSEFEAWRRERVGKERIPEILWSKAVALLSHCPIRVISKELKLSYKDLRRRQAVSGYRRVPYKEVPKQSLQTEAFLELSANEIAPSTALEKSSQVVTPPILLSATESVSVCQVVFERSDGSRLSLNLPADWTNLSTLCTSLLRA